jgi:hypothetical protein
MQRRTPPLSAFPVATSLATLIFLIVSLSAAFASGGPLIVDGNSHVVVMEYEAWFGPKAVTFSGTAAKPLLQSADMQPLGGGYDSADPAVIQQHVAWMKQMGIDAAAIDLSNNVSCIFNSDWFLKKYVPGCSPAFRASNRSIRDKTGNLYPAWTALGTNLKLIPLLGGIEDNVLFPDLDGKNALEKEIDYFGSLMRQYPERQVIYEGKPLMLIFLGAGQDPSFGDDPLWLKIRRFIEAHPEIGGRYTFREMAGYIDSQPDLWLNQGTPSGPVQLNRVYSFWSWVDRLNPTCTASPLCPYYPSYNQAGSRVENLTASIATAGQNGWGCPNSEAPPYCPDDALRYGGDRQYATFASFMDYARQLQPTFLIVHQFNEFVQPDEGWNANTDDDIEPADLWGFGALHAVEQQVRLYRESIDDTTATALR